MAKALSLKLKDEVFEEVEEITHKIKVPRNAYINRALEFYNSLNRRKLLAKQLERESKLVSAESMKVLKDLEEIEDDLIK